jgi:uncharacterized protein YlxW (UPF0749 family)
MSDDTDNGRQRDVRDRIASLMQSDGQVRRKEVSQEEAKTLRAASDRLDRLLKEFDEAEEARHKQASEKEVQTLRAAIGRLDCLLAGVTGNGGMPELKSASPRERQNRMR